MCFPMNQPLVMVSDPEGGWRVMPLRQGHSGLERDIPQAEDSF